MQEMQETHEPQKSETPETLDNTNSSTITDAVQNLKFIHQGDKIVASYRAPEKVKTVGDEILDHNKVTTTSKPVEQTAIEKIKNMQKVFEQMGSTDRAASLETFVDETFNAVTGKTSNHRQFEIEYTQQDAKSQWDSKPKDPGSLEHTYFEIDTNSGSGDVTRSFKAAEKTYPSELVTKGDVLQHQVNLAMMDDLQEAVYQAKFSLDKVAKVKESKFESLQNSMHQAQQLINQERQDLVLTILNEVVGYQPDNLATLAPEDRKLFTQANTLITTARNLVKKAGFVTNDGMNEKQVLELVSSAIKIWPSYRNDTRFNTLLDRIFLL